MASSPRRALERKVSLPPPDECSGGFGRKPPSSSEALQPDPLASPRPGPLGAAAASGHRPNFLRGSSAGARGSVRGSVRSSAAAAAATATERRVGRDTFEHLLEELGFHLDDLTSCEIFDEVDADGDGEINEEEFIASIGMLKRNVLELMELDKAFTKLGKNAREMQAGSTPGGRPPAIEEEDDLQLHAFETHLVRAIDLVAVLDVTEAEAEEMIFMADLEDNQAISFTEFKQVIVNWS